LVLDACSTLICMLHYLPIITDTTNRGRCDSTHHHDGIHPPSPTGICEVCVDIKAAGLLLVLAES
jgi:hypothetical protein